MFQTNPHVNGCNRDVGCPVFTEMIGHYLTRTAYSKYCEATWSDPKQSLHCLIWADLCFTDDDSSTSFSRSGVLRHRPKALRE
ncbi:hypothetical protein DTO280E4_1325 [Paecilomyces variotii]|nr:hypothetical protein DTO166G5_6580 [Paecilomyces variotii]KAJ9254232.1 hypothetical protein DTO195F2_6736 [Paecilomyces variotii]KAJ9364545.1 hypothetical protein DTO280E4_1325 [Paecilomyces variotii]